MTPVPKPKKNSLSIRLAESAVFLRSDYTHSRTRADPNPSSNSLLRGLLVLDVTKPTKITRIEVQLTATASITCPEGIGARHLDVTEHLRVFHSSTILFCASSPSWSAIAGDASRRSASIGPGISYTQGLFPQTISSRSDMEEHTESQQASWEDLHESIRAHQRRQSSPSPPPFTASLNARNLRRGRRLSVDLSRSLSSLPPYSQPLTIEEQPSSPNPPSRASSSILRELNSTETILEDESELPSFSVERDLTPPSTDTNDFHSPHRESSLHVPKPSNSFSSLDQQRGRDHLRSPASKRFSLSAVPSILLDAMRSSSPRRGLFSNSTDEVESRRESSSRQSPASIIRERLERGRTSERLDRTRDSTLEDAERSVCSERKGKDEKEKPSVLAKLLGEKEEWSEEFMPGIYTYPITFSIPSSSPPTMRVEYGSVSWKLKAFAHRPGTFHSKLSAERQVIVVACPTEEDTEDTESIIVERTWGSQMQYLISISGRAFFIGGTIPITIALMPMDKVKVHRIAVFVEEKVEYFSRFQRLIRAEPPMRFNLLSVRNEGKNSTPILPLESSCPDVLRCSPLFELLDPEARRDESSLGELAASFMGPGPWTFHKDMKLPNSCRSMNFSNKNLQANVKITHFLKVILRLEKASTPSEEDLQKAKPALFDIVIQTPVLILSCRCNPEWAALPRYTEVFEDMVQDISPTCPCRTRPQSPFASPRASTDSLVLGTGKSSAGLSSPATSAHEFGLSHGPRSEYAESIIRSSSLFERLVSGQESETGEAPPAYAVFCEGGTGHASGSTSVAVREVPLNGPRNPKSGIIL